MRIQIFPRFFFILSSCSSVVFGVYSVHSGMICFSCGHQIPNANSWITLIEPVQMQIQTLFQKRIYSYLFHFIWFFILFFCLIMSFIFFEQIYFCFCLRDSFFIRYFIHRYTRWYGNTNLSVWSSAHSSGAKSKRMRLNTFESKVNESVIHALRLKMNWLIWCMASIDFVF